MHDSAWLVWIVAIAGVIAAGWLGYVSIQSLLQAHVLRHRPAGPLRGREAGVLPVCGALRVTDPVSDARGMKCLWHRRVVQERRGYGKNRRWVKVMDDTKVAGYMVSYRGEEIDVVEVPTEVHGQQSHSETEGGFFERRVRITEYWLPILRQLTVLGRLETRGGRPVMVRDRKLGLLITPKDPDTAARDETMKGVAGLVGTAAILGAVVWGVVKVLGP